MRLNHGRLNIVKPVSSDVRFPKTTKGGNRGNHRNHPCCPETRGLGIACYGACVGTARQPELAGRLFTNFIIGAALAEALALLGFVLAFIL